jgi:hypothetical protein
MGVMEEECVAMLKSFFREARDKKARLTDERGPEK